LLAAIVPIAITAVRPANAYELRGPVSLNVLLCESNDYTTPALQPASYYRTEIATRGSGGLSDYWEATSNGAITLTTSQIHGWFTIPKSAKALHNESSSAFIGDCEAAATKANWTPPSGEITMVISAPGGIGAGGGRGSHPQLLVGKDDPMSEWAHELGHAFGLFHSFSQDLTFHPKDPTGSYYQGLPGEYDDRYDTMGSTYTFQHTAPGSPYANAPTLLNAYHMDQLGWVPRSRIKTFGADGSHDENVRIAALGHPEANGNFLLRVPLGPDPYSYYTVEMVSKDGWNAGIDKSRILIRRVQPIPYHTGAPDQYYISYIYQVKGDGEPYSNLKVDNGAHHMLIELKSIGTTSAVVHVSVQSPDAPTKVYGPNTCASGYVFREADDLDYICVTQAVRAQTLRENASAAANKSGSGCRTGFVPRRAWLQDETCVSPQSAAQAAADNATVLDRLAQPDTAALLKP
jgi:hypothetical protein